MIPPSSLAISQGWGLIDLPLRASNEGSLRPRVARAQEIIRLHPLLCSGSKGSARVSFHPIYRAASASTKGSGLLPTPLPKYCLWVYHKPVHHGTLILRGVWVSVVRQVLG